MSYPQNRTPNYGQNYNPNYGYDPYQGNPDYQPSDRPYDPSLSNQPYNAYEPYEAAPETDPADSEPTPEEKREMRQDRLRVIFGMGDFFGVVLGAVVILVLIALLVSLGNFVYNDLGLTLEWLLEAI